MITSKVPGFTSCCWAEPTPPSVFASASINAFVCSLSASLATNGARSLIPADGPSLPTVGPGSKRGSLRSSGHLPVNETFQPALRNSVSICIETYQLSPPIPFIRKMIATSGHGLPANSARNIGSSISRAQTPLRSLSVSNSAAAARALASAWAVSPAIRAILANSNSKATPPAINRSAMAWGINSDNGLPAKISDTSSTPNPTTISQPAISARRVFRSYTSSDGVFGFFGFPFATYCRPRIKPSRALVAAALTVTASYLAVLVWLVIKTL